MRPTFHRACLLGAALLAACAQEPVRNPAPAVDANRPVAPPTASQPAPKPKPKPKPSKPEPNGSDVTPAPSPTTAAPAEGIDRAQVGYYFDTLQGRLRKVADPNIAVTRNDDHISVDISRRVGFGADDAPLPAAACAALAPIAKALVEYKMTRVVADVSAAGSDDASLKSAKTHSAAVAKCLADAGIAPHRVSTREHASAQPAVVLRIEPIVK